MENKQYWEHDQFRKSLINCSRLVEGDVPVLGGIRCQNNSIGSYLETTRVGEFFHSVLIFFCKEHEPNVT